MEKTLQDLCRDAKDRQNLTIQALAEMTDISASTVSNFFSNSSKEPSAYKMGVICAALGVSMDRYFGIKERLSPEAQIVQMENERKNELEIAHLKGGMEQMSATIDYQRRKARDTKFAIYGLMLLCAIFMVVIVGYIFFDYRVPNQGLIQRGQASVFAWIVILLLATGIGIFAAIFLMSLRYAKQYAPSPDEGGGKQ